MIINFKDDYTETPGGRYIAEGKYSGEHFRETILKQKYFESLHNKDKLIINMDGCYGFPAIFLSEAFGGLAKQLNNPLIMGNIEIICNDEPYIHDRICEYISEYFEKG